jgi:hypothetical protein
MSLLTWGIKNMVKDATKWVVESPKCKLHETDFDRKYQAETILDNKFATKEQKQKAIQTLNRKG